MTEANFARARKVILCVGLLVAALLFLFPHWRLSSDFADGEPVASQELGRIFIAFKPFARSYGPYQFTPRPETVVASTAVEMPSRNRPWTSCSRVAVGWPARLSFSARAVQFTPRPSSVSWITNSSSIIRADTAIDPTEDLPFSTRSSGSSSP